MAQSLIASVKAMKSYFLFFLGLLASACAGFDDLPPQPKSKSGMESWRRVEKAEEPHPGHILKDTPGEEYEVEFFDDYLIPFSRWEGGRQKSYLYGRFLARHENEDVFESLWGKVAAHEDLHAVSPRGERLLVYNSYHREDRNARVVLARTNEELFSFHANFECNIPLPENTSCTAPNVKAAVSK
jgi:hypothetical protein